MEKSSSKQQHSTKNQHPPGVLNEGLIGHFKTVNESITELAIDSIQPCPIIPDYLSPTESFHPIVIQTPESYRCIDGLDLINKEKAAGGSSISCHVFEIENHSETELAIRKVSVRTKALGGTCSYPETIRNCRLLAEIIMDEKEDLVIFSHGGVRRGGSFTSNREDDLPEILAERLGKSRTTINTYLNQSEYINGDVFDALITAGVGRSFFYKCRIVKRDLIKNLKSEGLEDIEVLTAVSDNMLLWLDEYSQTGNVTSVHEETVPGEIDEPQASELTGEENETSEDEVFQHQTVVDIDDSQGLPTEEALKDEILTVIGVLTALAEQSPIEIDAGLEAVDEQFHKLAVIRDMLIFIRDNSRLDCVEEVA